MWLINISDNHYVVGDCSLPPQTALEVLPTMEWLAFLDNGVVASAVRKKQVWLTELEPDPVQYPYIDVVPRGERGTSYGICPACYGRIDALTGRSVDTGGGGGTGNAHTLYLQGDATPADVYYSDPNTLNIMQRS